MPSTTRTSQIARMPPAPARNFFSEATGKNSAVLAITAGRPKYDAQIAESVNTTNGGSDGRNKVNTRTKHYRYLESFSRRSEDMRHVYRVGTLTPQCVFVSARVRKKVRVWAKAEKLRYHKPNPLRRDL